MSYDSKGVKEIMRWLGILKLFYISSDGLNTTVKPVLSSHSKEDQKLIFKTFVLSFVEWTHKTVFTVCQIYFYLCELCPFSLTVTKIIGNVIVTMLCNVASHVQ